MAAAITSVAPLALSRMNSTFFVTGRPDGFTTIQQAVDYVRIFNNGTGIVIIVQGVDVADSIPAVTGGGISTWIWDNRAGNTQQWGWDGAKYVPADFDQAGGYIARGGVGHHPATTTLDYSPAGGAGNGRGDINVIANAGKGMPAIALTCYPSDGTGARTFFRGDQSPVDGRLRVQMPAALYLTPPDNLFNVWIGQPADINISKGMYIWTKPTENAVDLQALTASGIYDQTLRLNHLGGDVALGPLAVMTEGGSLHAIRGRFNGPVRIFHTPDNPAGLWIGDQDFYDDGGKGLFIIPVTAENAIEFQGQTLHGTYDQTLRLNPHGGDVEIPNLLVTSGLNVAGDLSVTGDVDIAGALQATSASFVECLVDNSPVRTFANTPDGGDGGSFPPAGIGVSLGDAWDDNSIDPVTVAYRDQNNTFTGQMVIQSADPSKQLLEIVNPTITKGTIKALDIGKAEAVNQKFFCNFYHDGDASTFNNFVEFTFWGVPTSLFIQPGGVCVGGTRRNDAAFCVSGTTHLYDTLLADKDVQVNGALRIASSPATTRLSVSTLDTPNHSVRFAAHTAGDVAYGGSFQFDSWNNDFSRAATMLYMGDYADHYASIFYYDVSVEGKLSAINNHLRFIDRTATLTGSPSISTGGTNLVINPGPGASDAVYLSYDQGGGGVAFGDGAGTIVALMDKGGTLTAKCLNANGNGAAQDSSLHMAHIGDATYIDSYGNGAGRGTFNFRQASNAAGLNLQTPLAIDGNGVVVIDTSFRLSYNATTLFGAVYDSYGVNASNVGAHIFRGYSSDGSLAYNPLNIYGDHLDVAGAIAANGGLVVNNGPTSIPFAANQLRVSTAANIGYLDVMGQDPSTNGYFIWRSWHSDGSNMVSLGQLNTIGLYINGTISCGGTKAFVVPHPLEQNKELLHACLEGPENGVYYRGEAVIVDGYAVVTLPDYFEALTFEDDRSVQLSQVYEGTPLFARMAASRIVNGQFTIQATEAVTVAWEVKAVRRIGVERLEVTRNKMTVPAPTEGEHDSEQRSTHRTGARETGKLRAQAQRNTTSTPN